MLTPERPRNGECGPDFCPIGLSERFSALETAVKINGETQNKLFEELNRRLFGNGQPGGAGVDQAPGGRSGEVEVAGCRRGRGAGSTVGVNQDLHWESRTTLATTIR